MRSIPFKSVCKSYMATYTGIFAASTVAEVGRRLNRIGEVVSMLQESMEIASDDPRRWSAEDIVKIVAALKSYFDVSAASLAHLVSDLNRLCLFRGSNAVGVAKVRYPAAFPKGKRFKLSSISDDDRECLIHFFGKLTGSDLRNAAPSILAMATGGRCMEIANLQVRDIDLESWTVTFRIVKGLGSYGHARTVPILADCRYLVERILDCGHSDYVVCNSVTGSPLTTNSLRRMRQRTEALSGIHFEYRSLRRAYADSLRAAGLPMDAVSVALGHDSTDTTESYYSRITESDVLSMYRKTVQKKDDGDMSGSKRMVHPPGFEPGQQAWKA